MVDILYRPFDIRKTMFTGKSKGFLAYPRAETMKQMLKPNLGLITSRQQVLSGFRHVLVSKDVIESGAVSLKTKEWNYLCPLYLYPEDGQLYVDAAGAIPAAREPNIDLLIGREIASKIGAVYYGVAEYPAEKGDTRLTPEDIFITPMLFSTARLIAPAMQSSSKLTSRACHLRATKFSLQN